MELMPYIKIFSVKTICEFMHIMGVCFTDDKSEYFNIFMQFFNVKKITVITIRRKKKSLHKKFTNLMLC